MCLGIMFWSAEMVNEANSTDDSELKPLMFPQPCQQNSVLHPPRTGTNDCVSYCCRSAPSSTSFPEPNTATSLVRSLGHQMQDRRGLESGWVPTLSCAASLNGTRWKGSARERACWQRQAQSGDRCTSCGVWPPLTRDGELHWACCLLRLVRRVTALLLSLFAWFCHCNVVGMIV